MHITFMVICEGKYIGEGGWFFASHGVENNKLHWEEVTDTERIEVTGLVRIDRAGSFVSSPSNRWQYIFYTNNDLPISESQFPVIKEAIQKVLNPETDLQKEKDVIPLGELQPKEEKKEQSKDWEVVAFSGNGFFKKGEPMFEYAYHAYNEKRGVAIHSVRRLSDGGVFSVGDFAFMTSCDFYKIKIKGFEIDNGRIRVRYEHTMWCFIDSLSKEDKRTKYLDQWHEDDTGYYRNPPNTDKQHK